MTSITDNHGDTYNKLDSVEWTRAPDYSNLFYASISSTESITINITSSSSAYYIFGYDISGYSTSISTSTGETAGSPSLGSSANVTSFTPVSDSFVVGVVTDNVNKIAGSDYTLQGSSSSWAAGSEYNSSWTAGATQVPFSGQTYGFAEAAASFTPIVTVQIGLSVQNGATSDSASVSCSGGGGTYTTSGGTQDFSCAYKSPVTVTLSGGSNNEWCFTGHCTTTETFTPSVSAPGGTSTTQSYNYYENYKVTLSYSVSGGGSGYSAPSLIATQSGSSYSPSLTTSATAYWFDSTGSVSISTSNGGTGERWSPSTSSISATASSTTIIDFYHQYYVTFSYSISGAGSGYSAPTVTCYVLGSSTSCTKGWVDATSFSYTNPLTGSTSSERWETNSNSGTVSANTTYSETFHNQLNATFEYYLTSGSITAPKLTATQFGSSYNPSLTTSFATYWLDNHTSWSVPTTANSIVTNRWISSNVTSGTVSIAFSERFVYYDQYNFTIYYSIVDGGNPGAPTFSSTQYGSEYQVSLTLSSATYWPDLGASWSLMNPLTRSDSTERWSSTNTTSGTASAALEGDFLYYNQFNFTASYSLIGGGSPSAPTLSGTQFGASYIPTLSTSATRYWLDNHTSWSVTNPLSSSTSSERWRTNSTISGTIVASSISVFSYNHQFFLNITVQAASGSSGAINASSTFINSGDGIYLKAIAATGSFSSWGCSGSGCYSGTSATTSLITMNNAINETAIFGDIVILPVYCAMGSHSSSANLSITGGNPVPSSFSCRGTVVSVQIPPSTGYTFSTTAATSTVRYILSIYSGTSCATGICARVNVTNYQQFNLTNSQLLSIKAYTNGTLSTSTSRNIWVDAYTTFTSSGVVPDNFPMDYSGFVAQENSKGFQLLSNISFSGLEFNGVSNQLSWLSSGPSHSKISIISGYTVASSSSPIIPSGNLADMNQSSTQLYINLNPPGSTGGESSSGGSIVVSVTTRTGNATTTETVVSQINPNGQPIPQTSFDSALGIIVLLFLVVGAAGYYSRKHQREANHPRLKL